MWKTTILLLSGLMCLTQARPGYLHTPSYLPAYEEHVEYTPTVVGHTVHSVPTAVSHQSQTIVHEKRPYLRPIIGHTPHIVEHAPISHVYAPTTSVALPVGFSPLPYSGLYDHGWSPSLSAAYGGYGSYGGYGGYGGYGDWNGWPLK